MKYQKIIKFLAVALCCSCLLSGCYTTGYVTEGLLNPESIEYQPQEDKIIAMGYIQQPNNQKNIVFVGEKYTYRPMGDSSVQLTKLFDQLKPKERVLISQQPMEFKVNENGVIEGDLDFMYPTPADKVNADFAQKVLIPLGFVVNRSSNPHDNHQYYYKYIDLKAEVYQPLDKKQITTTFKQSYPVILKQPVKRYSHGKAVARVALKPVTMAIDTALLPIIVPWYINEMATHR